MTPMLSPSRPAPRAADTLPVGLRVVVVPDGHTWGGWATDGHAGVVESVFVPPGRGVDALRVRLDDGRLVPFWPNELEVVPQ